MSWNSPIPKILNQTSIKVLHGQISYRPSLPGQLRGWIHAERCKLRNQRVAKIWNRLRIDFRFQEANGNCATRNRVQHVTSTANMTAEGYRGARQKHNKIVVVPRHQFDPPASIATAAFEVRFRLSFSEIIRPAAATFSKL